jgi:hypothetical protein
VGPAAVSLGHNLSDDGSCSFLTAIGDLNNTPAALDPGGLRNNGGPTNTIALLPNSRAVNAIPLRPVNYCTAIDGVTPIATDQRGVPRLQGSGCDIGAFELVFAPTTPAPPTLPLIILGLACCGIYLWWMERRRATRS